MSRVLNLDATMEAVTEMCQRHAIAISAIEPLLSGGTRVVPASSDGAADLRRRMKASLIESGAIRSGAYVGRRP